MNEPRHNRPAGGGIRRAVLLGLFAGTGVGVGYLLSGVPNLELVTLLSPTMMPSSFTLLNVTLLGDSINKTP